VTNKEYKLSTTDCLTGLPLTIKILTKKAPMWTFAFFAMSLIETLIPDTRDYHLFARLFGIAMTVCFSAVCCLLVTGYWKYLNNEDWTATPADVARAGKVWILMDLYWLAVVLGLCLFILPGLLLAAGGCVAQPIMCIEKKGPITSFNLSSAITKGHLRMVGRYFALPVIIGLVQWLAVPAAVACFVSEGDAAAAFSSWEWKINHLPLASVLALNAAGTWLFHLSVVAMQVKLYHHLKTKAAPPAEANPVPRWES
jgi:hypothetical protein